MYIKRIFCLFGLLLVCGVASSAEDRKDLSVEDIVSGFERGELFYFETIFQNGKYIKAFNKCLASMPADPAFIMQKCEKNPEFKNVFECAENEEFKHVWFVYENAQKCEEVRGPMKDKMDAVRE